MPKTAPPTGGLAQQWILAAILRCWRADAAAMRRLALQVSVTAPRDMAVGEDSRRTSRSALIAETAAVGLVLLVTTLVHLRALAKPFFADDYLFLEQARGRSIVTLLASPDPLGNFFRPFSRQFYFWLVARLSQESPTGFHLFGLGLFLGSLFLLYLITRGFLGRASAVFALGFVALHYSADVPIAWASGSQDLLAILFATLAI